MSLVTILVTTLTLIAMFVTLIVTPLVTILVTTLTLIAMFVTLITDMVTPLVTILATLLVTFLVTLLVTVLQVVEMDKKLYDATEAYEEGGVPGGGYMRPKHHFGSHAAIDILNLGPMPGFWAWSFEGFHQRVKRIMKSSNYKDVGRRIISFFGMQFAMYSACPDESKKKSMANLC